MEIWSKYGPNTNIQQRQRKKSHTNTHIQSVAFICICIDIHLRCDCFIIFINMTHKLVKMNWLIKFRPMETTLNRFANTDRKKMHGRFRFVCLFVCECKWSTECKNIYTHTHTCAQAKADKMHFSQRIYIYLDIVCDSMYFWIIFTLNQIHLHKIIEILFD